MSFKLPYCLFIIGCFLSYSSFAQDISLYKQYNGRFDFLFLGNTLNTIENNNIDGLPEPPCTILSNSSASLYLNPNDRIEDAYLYWAGSGTGDFEVQLNREIIKAERTFSIKNSRGYAFFSAFTKVTSLIQSTGNGSYTFSGLDLSDIIADYCPFGGNFGGWAIVIVYKNDSFPLNQLNIYDGLQSVPNKINFTLNSLNVVDNQDAKIGFVAWEGDKNIEEGESLFINGNLIGNPPLNPSNNAFNGTNSYLGTDNLFNMDLDIYTIQNNIKIGDTQAQITLTSNRDFVMINSIVTKLNSQLPDASVRVNGIDTKCKSKMITVDYTVSNINGTNPLPENTPIAIYANGILLAQTKTQFIIPIDGSESSSLSLTIPDSIPNNFELQFVIDDTGSGQGIVNELNEKNNSFITTVSLPVPDTLKVLEDVFSCNIGFGKGIFDFSSYENSIKVNTTDKVTFYHSMSDLDRETNEILNTSNYNSSATTETIFVKVDNGTCISTTSFQLRTRNCPPTVYNFVSANNDSKNDTFYIAGLRNIFLHFELSIYNRWGRLLWTGDTNSEDWDGSATKGPVIGSNAVPSGTYFYVLDLKDPDYSEPLQGYLFLTR